MDYNLLKTKQNKTNKQTNKQNKMKSSKTTSLAFPVVIQQSAIRARLTGFHIPTES